MESDLGYSKRDRCAHINIKNETLTKSEVADNLKYCGLKKCGGNIYKRATWYYNRNSSFECGICQECGILICSICFTEIEEAKEKEEPERIRIAFAKLEEYQKAKDKVVLEERERIALAKLEEEKRKANEKAELEERKRIARVKLEEWKQKEKEIAEQEERERIARVKLEEEKQKPKDKAEKEERERIAFAKLEEIAFAKLKETKRKAKEKAEQEEKERIARVKLEEEERKAKEKAEQEEKERIARVKLEEEKQKAKVKAEQEEKERIARVKLEEEKQKAKLEEEKRKAKEKAEQEERERIARVKLEEEKQKAKLEEEKRINELVKNALLKQLGEMQLKEKENNDKKIPILQGSDDFRLLVDKSKNLININTDKPTELVNAKHFQYIKKEVDSEHFRGLNRSQYLIEFEELTFYRTKRGQYIELGNGAFGNVYLGEYNGSKVAIKKIEIGKNGIEKENILKEIDLMLSIRHANNCNIYGYVEDEEEDALLIVIEYCTDGSLLDVVSNKTIEIDFKMKKSWLLQIAQGMNYLHCKKPPILHRDLKPENIFLTNGLSRAVIGDFGLSKPIHSRYVGKLTSFVGTVPWMAPEVLRGESYDLQADVYSFGIIMFEVLSRSRPYQNYKGKTNEFEKLVLEGERPDINNNKFTEIGFELILLMKSCWDSNPLKRPDFKEIVKKLSSWN